jgi:hypothetical protein
MPLQTTQVPNNWLERIGGADASGWLGAFRVDAQAAVDALIWDRFYLGPLNLVERSQLLLGWLEVLDDQDGFATALDSVLSKWIENNWGKQSDAPIETVVSAWNCVNSVVQGSASLRNESRLHKAAQVLKQRFVTRQSFLGSISTTLGSDPLGLYLAAIAEFQTNRSLAGFWHRMCDLGDGVPFYHARYAILGLRRLPAANNLEAGTLRAEVVRGLIRLTQAFDRLVREHRLREDHARSTLRRVAAQTAAAYPDSPNWVRYGLDAVLALPEKAQGWLLEGVKPLADAVRAAKKKSPETRRYVLPEQRPDSFGYEGFRDIVAKVESRQVVGLELAEQLLSEQRSYAETTGETYFVARSLCFFADRAMSWRRDFSEKCALEAIYWEPRNRVTWTTATNVLLHERKFNLALIVAWVAYAKFPESLIVRRSLAALLSKVRRQDEASAIRAASDQAFRDSSTSEDVESLERNYRSTAALQDDEQRVLRGLPNIASDSPLFEFLVPAFVAEASFYRRWALDAAADVARGRRAISARLLQQASQLSPDDPEVETEKFTLAVDQGEAETIKVRLQNALSSHPAAAPLLALEAKLKREAAAAQKLPLTDDSLNELILPVTRLRELNGSFASLFHLQRGLATLALSNGSVRVEQAAQAFSSFRKNLAIRADEERMEREALTDKRERTNLKFHEWLLPRVEKQFFSGVSQSTSVASGEMPFVEAAIQQHRRELEEIEECLVRRVSLAAV